MPIAPDELLKLQLARYDIEYIVSKIDDELRDQDIKSRYLIALEELPVQIVDDVIAVYTRVGWRVHRSVRHENQGGGAYQSAGWNLEFIPEL